jgi:acetylornithine deacetylase
VLRAASGQAAFALRVHARRGFQLQGEIVASISDLPMPAFAAVSTAQIAAAVQATVPYMTDTLARFVAAQSLSGEEMPAARFVEDVLGELGLASERIVLRTDLLREEPLFSPPCCADGGRYNVLALHRPTRGGGRSVLFNGHLDVVPTGSADLWSSPPFSGDLRDGWLFGRGAGDMKAGLVCAFAAYRALRLLGLQPGGVVGFNGVLEEENTGNGTLATVSALRQAMNAARLTAFDAVLIPEPTGEALVDAQLGVFWMYVDITGKPAHAAYMSTGVSALEAGLRIIDALKTLEREWNLPENRHLRYRDHDHPINFNVGQLHAGDWNSSVPSACTLGLRLACYPDMSIDDAKQRVQACVRAAQAALKRDDIRVEFRYEGFHAPGCEYDLDVPAMQRLADAHVRVTGAPAHRSALTATTDARHFRKMLDVPVTCYGPVARNIHGFDECVSVDSMVNVATVFAHFIADWCGVEPIPA